MSPVGGPLQEILAKKMYTLELCGDAYYSNFKHWMKESQGVCVQPQGYGKMCMGDSGSPFVCRSKTDNRWYLTGVGSWSFVTCLIIKIPSVYTPINYFADWINLAIDSFQNGL